MRRVALFAQHATRLGQVALGGAAHLRIFEPEPVQRLDNFRRECGNQFLAGGVFGGEIVAVLRVEHFNADDQASAQADIRQNVAGRWEDASAADVVGRDLFVASLNRLGARYAARAAGIPSSRSASTRGTATSCCAWRGRCSC